MGALAMMVLAFAGYIIMYQLYGKFVGAKIFALSGAAKPPAVEMEDGIDYVPTRKEIIFGHHYTSIAGTGPIVGPAIAIIWGWVPALIWVLVGSVVMALPLVSIPLSRHQWELRANVAPQLIRDQVENVAFNDLRHSARKPTRRPGDSSRDPPDRAPAARSPWRASWPPGRRRGRSSAPIVSGKSVWPF